MLLTFTFITKLELILFFFFFWYGMTVLHISIIIQKSCVCTVEFPSPSLLFFFFFSPFSRGEVQEDNFSLAACSAIRVSIHSLSLQQSFALNIDKVVTSCLRKAK